VINLPKMILVLPLKSIQGRTRGKPGSISKRNNALSNTHVSTYEPDYSLTFDGSQSAKVNKIK